MTRGKFLASLCALPFVGSLFGRDSREEQFAKVATALEPEALTAIAASTWKAEYDQEPVTYTATYHTTGFCRCDINGVPVCLPIFR